MGTEQSRQKYSFPKEDLEFISQKTKISKQEVQLRLHVFLKDHREGKIRKKEFPKELLDFFPTKGRETLEPLFFIFDENDDGFVDFKEFMIIFYVLSHGSLHDSLEPIFR